MRKLVLMLMVAGGVTTSWACAPGRTGPEPAISSLVVRNRSTFDVNVYSVPSPRGPILRLGTVVGSTSVTFPIHARDLEAGTLLVVRLHAIGSRSSWTSGGVAVNDGVVAVLDVDADPWGNCSRSSLYTIITTDSIRAAKE